MATAYRIMCR